MKRKIKSSQNGAISVFVMITMVFFLLSILGVYLISSKRAQTQTESAQLIQGQYYTENEENDRYRSKIADNLAIIPIYTKEQLWSIGSGTAIEIEGKVYTFSSGANYELKNDIVINIEEIKGSNTIDESKIMKNNYEIYYYYNEDYYVPTSAENSKLLINGNYYTYKNLSQNLGYVTDGLVLHYDGIKNTAMGHDAFSTTWKDLSGNGNDGTLMGGGTWNENSLNFDGIDDYVEALDPTNIPMGSSAYTMEIVFETGMNNTNGGLIDIGTHRQAGKSNALRIMDKTRFRHYYWSNDLDSENVLTRNKKYSVIALNRGTDRRLYFNGSLLVNNTATPDVVFERLLIGSSESTHQDYLDGKIYSIKLYYRGLSDSEITRNYQIDKTRFEIN